MGNGNKKVNNNMPPNILCKKTTGIIDIGLKTYRESYLLQKNYVENRAADKINDTLIFVEHKPVITIGRSGSKDHLLKSKLELKQNNIDVIEVNRGGDITYHGPGQLVGYPIMKLDRNSLDINQLSRCYEEVIIRTLAKYGINAERITGYTGVWYKNNKIAAIGIGIKKQITFHGFAINNDLDLTPFTYIIPCGIKDKGVTSIKEILDYGVDKTDLINSVASSFKKIFNTSLNWRSSDDISLMDQTEGPK